MLTISHANTGVLCWLLGRLSRFVGKEAQKIEVVLQLAGMDVDKLEQSFTVFWPDGAAEDLVAILRMKGEVLAIGNVTGIGIEAGFGMYVHRRWQCIWLVCRCTLRHTEGNCHPGRC